MEQLDLFGVAQARIDRAARFLELADPNEDGWLCWFCQIRESNESHLQVNHGLASYYDWDWRTQCARQTLLASQAASREARERRALDSASSPTSPSAPCPPSRR